MKSEGEWATTFLEKYYFTIPLGKLEEAIGETKHMTLDTEGLINWIKERGNNGIITRNGKDVSTDEALDYLNTQLSRGVKEVSQCPTPNPDGSCPGHIEKEEFDIDIDLCDHGVRLEDCPVCGEGLTDTETEGPVRDPDYEKEIEDLEGVELPPEDDYSEEGDVGQTLIPYACPNDNFETQSWAEYIEHMAGHKEEEQMASNECPICYDEPTKSYSDEEFAKHMEEKHGLKLEEAISFFEETSLTCPKCNTVIDVPFLSDVVECPNCGTSVSKESAGSVNFEEAQKPGSIEQHICDKKCGCDCDEEECYCDCACDPKYPSGVQREEGVGNSGIYCSDGHASVEMDEVFDKGENRYQCKICGRFVKASKVEEGKDKKPNPWAICTAKVGRKDKDKYERCVMKVKKQYGIHAKSEEEFYEQYEEKIEPHEWVVGGPEDGRHCWICDEFPEASIHKVKKEEEGKAAKITSYKDPDLGVIYLIELPTDAVIITDENGDYFKTPESAQNFIDKQIKKEV